MTTAPDATGRKLAANPTGSWVIDLDGVVWLAGEPIRGVGEAIERLHGAGARVLFASNNSSSSIAVFLERLERAGIEALPHEVVTSAQAAASMIEAGRTALVVGDEGVVEALGARGVHVVTAVGGSGADAHVPDVDVVVVGWTRRFDFGLLAAASRAVRAGARLIGTNEDPTYPTPDGLLPGAGSVLAAVATASGAAPEVAGKPHEPLARLIAERAGRVAAVVGDRPSTDGALAKHLGAPFALVLSGVTAPGDPLPEPPPDLVAPDLLAVVSAATA
ncbi:MAG: HAD-IIA family hydrolase [Acidimicrobiales bacterium]